MRFVRVKTEEQQAALMQHTSRQLLIDQRTAVANSLRGQLAEFGVIENQGIENLADLARRLDEEDPAIAHIPDLTVPLSERALVTSWRPRRLGSPCAFQSRERTRLTSRRSHPNNSTRAATTRSAPCVRARAAATSFCRWSS